MVCVGLRRDVHTAERQMTNTDSYWVLCICYWYLSGSRSWANVNAHYMYRHHVRQRSMMNILMAL